MSIHNAFRRQVALLTRAPLASEARTQVRLLEKRKNLSRQVRWILIRPNSCYAIFDQLAAGRRLATDYRATVGPSLNVRDAKGFVRGRETKDVAAGDCVGFACLIWHS